MPSFNIPQTAFYLSTGEFIHQFRPAFYDETILLKGARLFEFELISHLLGAEDTPDRAGDQSQRHHA